VTVRSEKNEEVTGRRFSSARSRSKAELGKNLVDVSRSKTID
jgi:hypothetical protein